MNIILDGGIVMVLHRGIIGYPENHRYHQEEENAEENLENLEKQEKQEKQGNPEKIKHVFSCFSFLYEV